MANSEQRMRPSMPVEVQARSRPPSQPQGHDVSPGASLHDSTHFDPGGGGSGRPLEDRARLLQLQRLAGNRAVQKVLSGAPTGRLGSSFSPALERSSASDRINATDRRLQRSRDPDVVAAHEGLTYYSFYLSRLANVGRERGFKAQFRTIPGGGRGVVAKVASFPPIQRLDRYFELPAGKTLAPKLLEETASSATFDLDGDGQADLDIALFAGPATGGIDVVVTRPGIVLGEFTIRPPGGRRTEPYRGIEIGRLPNGRRYYLQPWTSHLRGGPLYVDERGKPVNPGREQANAEFLSSVGRSYAMAWAAVAASLGLATAASTAAGAAALARGAATVRWLFSGSRLVAGGTSAGANLATQAFEYGGQWERYNWGSVGFDYVIGAVSYSLAKGIVNRWPAPLFSRKIGSLSTWVNLGKQQAAMTLYGLLVGLGRAQVGRTGQGRTVGAQFTEGAVQAVKANAIDQFLRTPTGRRVFPAGKDDPRVVFISRSLTFVTKFAAREIWGVRPEAESAPAR